MRTPWWIAIMLLAATLSCERDTEATIQAPGQSSVTITDGELAEYLKWLLEHMSATNQHRAELEALSRRMAQRYPDAETHRVVDDPELLAVTTRQRTAMQELEARSPISGVKRSALEEVLTGIAPREFHPDKMTYSHRRDDSVLAGARKRYGDDFVDWVLSRESQIVATLAP